MSHKVLFERGRWQICEGTVVKGLGAQRGVWVWHKECPEMPEHEVEENQECWIPGDLRPQCIVCEKKLPDAILALVLLYTNAV